MSFVKNKTPYNGLIKFKLEKFPHYTGESILNKVHLNLGFTKLVSRMHPYKSLDGWEVNKEKIIKICMYTGGTIKTYEWWEVRGVNGVFKSSSVPKNKKDIVFHGKLENSFMYGNTYLGDIKAGWWYYQNRLVVCETYPKGVAIKVKKDYWSGDVPYMDSIEGAYGFSHRGGQLFLIGDRLFENDYQPHVGDYTPEQWKMWHDKYRKAFAKASNSEKRLVASNGVRAYIPFNMRGRITITSMKDMIQSANNLSKHLS